MYNFLDKDFTTYNNKYSNMYNKILNFFYTFADCCYREV